MYIINSHKNMCGAGCAPPAMQVLPFGTCETTTRVQKVQNHTDRLLWCSLAWNQPELCVKTGFISHVQNDRKSSAALSLGHYYKPQEGNTEDAWGDV